MFVLCRVSFMFYFVFCSIPVLTSRKASNAIWHSRTFRGQLIMGGVRFYGCLVIWRGVLTVYLLFDLLHHCVAGRLHACAGGWLGVVWDRRASVLCASECSRHSRDSIIFYKSVAPTHIRTCTRRSICCDSYVYCMYVLTSSLFCSLFFFMLHLVVQPIRVPHPISWLRRVRS